MEHDQNLPFVKNKSSKSNNSNSYFRSCIKPEEELLKRQQINEKLEEMKIKNLKLNKVSSSNYSNRDNRNLLPLDTSIPTYKSKIFQLELFKKLDSMLLNRKKLDHDDYKLNNINFENKLEKKRKKLEVKLSDTRIQKIQLMENLNNINIELDELKIEIDLFSNNDQYLKKSVNKRRKKSEKNVLTLISSKKNLENELGLKKEKIENKIIEKKELLQYIDYLKNQKLNLNKELKNTKEELLIHYHKLLKEGVDTRKEGLIWIFKSIWALKSEVNPSLIPKFLDEKSIKFLYDLASKDVEIQKFKDKAKELKIKLSAYKSFDDRKKLNIRNSRTKNNKLTNCIKEVEQSINSEQSYIKKRLESMYSNVKFVSLASNFEDHFTNKIIERIIDKTNPKAQSDNESINMINEILELQKEEEKVRIKIKNLKINELNRINIEFLLNDYERRFEVNLEKIISVLMGEEFISKEFSLKLTKQREYIEKIKSCRTFNLIDKSNNNLISLLSLESLKNLKKNNLTTE